MALLDPGQRAQILGGGEVSFTGVVGGDRSRILATTAGPGRDVLVVAGTGTDVSDAAVDHVQWGLLLGGPFAVVLAGVGAWLLAGAALRESRHLAEGLRGAAQDDPVGHRLTGSRRCPWAAP